MSDEEVLSNSSGTESSSSSSSSSEGGGVSGRAAAAVETPLLFLQPPPPPLPPPIAITPNAMLILKRPIHHHHPSSSSSSWLGGNGTVVPERIPLLTSHAAVGEQGIVLGRGSKASVFIYASAHPSFVSRDHAQFTTPQDGGGTWHVRDMASVNGVFVQQQQHHSSTRKVTKLGRESWALTSGDRVFFGNPQHSFFVEYEFVVVTALEEEAAIVEYQAPAPTRRTAAVVVTSEEVPNEIWLFRVLPFVDLHGLAQCAQVSSLWRRRVGEAVRMLRTVHWRHEWNVDALPQLLFAASNNNLAASSPRHPLTLRLQGCLRMRNNVLVSLSARLGPRLVSLDLSGTPAMSAMAMTILVTCCGKSLKQLRLRGCKRIGFPSWDWLALGLPELEWLDLCCTGSGDAAIDSLVAPKLRWIELGVMAGGGAHASVTDASLVQLASKCELLEGIDVRGCKRLTDAGIRAFCQQIGGGGGRLQSLVLHSCDVSDATLSAIAVHCPALQVLDIHRCHRVTDAGVHQLHMLRGTLRRLDLSNLVISDAGLIQALAGDGEEDEERLISSSSVLEELDLRTCKWVSGRAVLRVVQACAASLRVLDLNGCARVLPEHVLAMAPLLLAPRTSRSSRFACLEIGGRDEDDAALRHAWTREDVDRCALAFPAGVLHATFDSLMEPTQLQLAAAAEQEEEEAEEEDGEEEDDDDEEEKAEEE